MTPAAFTPLVGDGFSLLRRGGRPLLLRLDEVQEPPFALVFSSADPVALPQVTYLRHEALGPFASSLSPAGTDAGRARSAARGTGWLR